MPPEPEPTELLARVRGARHLLRYLRRGLLRGGARDDAEAARVVVVVVVVVVVAAAGADGRSATASPLNAAARDARTNLRESDATTNFDASATHGVRRAAREPEARITAGARSDTAAVVRDAIVSGV